MSNHHFDCEASSTLEREITNYPWNHLGLERNPLANADEISISVGFAAPADPRQLVRATGCLCDSETLSDGRLRGGVQRALMGARALYESMVSEMPSDATVPTSTGMHCTVATETSDGSYTVVLVDMHQPAIVETSTWVA